MLDLMLRQITMVILAAMLMWPMPLVAQESFFKGKTVRIVVGFAAGGGFDTYSRAMARYWGRHIPGNPSIIVENMAGAGSLIAANHVYKAARPDGLTIGNFGGGLFMQQLKGGAGIEFDARKFEFLGVPVQDNRSCAFTKASGITSMERWMAAKTPVKVGATAPGDLVHDGPKILQAALGSADSSGIGLQGHGGYSTGRGGGRVGRRLLGLGLDQSHLVAGARERRCGRGGADGLQTAFRPAKSAAGEQLR